jgi:hypothetical protein
MEMEKPDFLHEALQRLIFDFLMQHKHERFMKFKTHATHRKIEANPWQDFYQTPSSNTSSRSEMEQ